MAISAALTADLKSLTDPLDQPGTDLKALLARLADDTRRAVRSYVGLTMTLIVDTCPVTLTAMDEFADPADIASSALLPLPALCNAEPGSVIVFYAAKAGAFVDFAADLSFALGLGLDALALDEQLTPPGGMSGLADISQMNQAIGILIDRGHTPESAGGGLHRFARLAGITVHAAAQLIRANAQRPGIEQAGSRGGNSQHALDIGQALALLRACVHERGAHYLPDLGLPDLGLPDLGRQDALGPSCPQPAPPPRRIVGLAFMRSGVVNKGLQALDRGNITKLYADDARVLDLTLGALVVLRQAEIQENRGATWGEASAAAAAAAVRFLDLVPDRAFGLSTR